MKKAMLFALAAVSAAMFALPAVASAGEWQIDPAGVGFTAKNVRNTVLKTNNNETVTCTGSSGKGSYNAGSQTTGTLELTFTGCTTQTIFGTVSCTSSGLAAGTITTTTVSFTNVYLTKNSKEKPGIRLQGAGANEHFATFSCSLVTIEVTGTLYGESESKCGAKSLTHSVLFQSISHGVQKWTTKTESEEFGDLTANVSGTPRTASQDGTGTLTFEKEATVTCV